jgi:outer membrane protein, heavy metal efflux system
MRTMAAHGLLGLVLMASTVTGCATQQERTTDRRLSAARERWKPERPAEPPSIDGSFGAYLAYAMHHSPELEASFARWRAATLRISRERRLPEPEIGYAYFVRNVETRVGPQRHRLSLRQAFPWPTRLSAGADSAALVARAAEARFEALATEVQARVARAYWRLWLIHRSHRIYVKQEHVLEGLAESVRARVETGDAGLADLSQVHLRLERHRDHAAQHHEAMRAASAELVAVIGAPEGTPTPIRDTPREGLPAEDRGRLMEAALEHPRIEEHAWLAESSEAAERAAGAGRYPGFTVGLDWIETGPARVQEVDDSGKDAVVASLMVSVPLWGGSYRDEMAAARAEGAAREADGEAARRTAAAELERALSEVRDAQRRIELYRDVLVPEAETVHASLLGGLGAGRASLAQTLLSERELLELHVDLARARAEHAAAWAFLERVVGRPVERDR